MAYAIVGEMSRHIPESVKKVVYERDGGRCRICGRHSEYMEYDHITPYRYGAPATVENIQLLCRRCNLKKRDKTDHCESCGSWIPHDAELCHKCGTRITKTAETTYAQPQKRRLIENPVTRMALWILAVGLIFFSVSSLVVGGVTYVAGIWPFSSLRGQTSDGGAACVVSSNSGGNVNLRKDCDTKDCALDPTTIFIEVPSGTTTHLRTGKKAYSKGFTWLPVRYDSQDLWVSSATAKCSN